MTLTKGIKTNYISDTRQTNMNSQRSICLMSTKRGRINVRMDDDLEKAVDYIQKKHKEDSYLELTESDIVRASIRYYKEYLEQKNKDEKD